MRKVEHTQHGRMQGREDTLAQVQRLVDWPDFRRVMRDLIELCQQGQVIRIAQLTSSMPEEAQDLITGMTSIQEAWLGRQEHD